MTINLDNQHKMADYYLKCVSNIPYSDNIESICEYYQKLHHYLTFANSVLASPYYYDIKPYDPSKHVTNKLYISVDTEGDGYRTESGNADIQLDNMVSFGFVFFALKRTGGIELLGIQKSVMARNNVKTNKEEALEKDSPRNPFWKTENNLKIWNDMCDRQESRSKVAEVTRLVIEQFVSSGWKPHFVGWPLAYDFGQMNQFFWGQNYANPFDFGGVAVTQCIGQQIKKISEAFGIENSIDEFPNQLKKKVLSLLTNGRQDVTHSPVYDAIDQMVIYLLVDDLFKQFVKSKYDQEIRKKFAALTGAKLIE